MLKELCLPPLRGAEPSCGDGLRVGADQRSGQLGSSSAGHGHKLPDRILCPAWREAADRQSGPQAELHSAEGPPG